MAIFIIDQFSLNTDLPLDIRYVPAGGTYFDVSAYWYPGMQVYQTSDEAIWYADNSLNWHKLGEGGDASLNDLWSYVTDLSTRVYANEVSLGNLTVWNNNQDISIFNNSIGISGLESSIGDIDASIQNLDLLTQAHESSLGNLTVWNNNQDISIFNSSQSITNIESSVNVLDLLTQAHKTSLGPDDVFTEFVTNLNAIWIDVDVAGEGVDYEVPQ